MCSRRIPTRPSSGSWSLFESKTAYDANAASPEQDGEYWALRRLLSEDPQWHDGAVVFDSQNS